MKNVKSQVDAGGKHPHVSGAARKQVVAEL